MVVRLHAESVQEVCGIALGIPAVHIRELILEFRRLDAVLVGKVLLRIEGVLLLHDVIEALISHNDGVQHRELIVLKVVLLQEGETLSRRNRDVAVRGFQLARENFQESGLSRSVRADEAVTISLCKLNVYVLKERLLADAERNAVCTDHIFFPLLITVFFSCCRPAAFCPQTGARPRRQRALRRWSPVPCPGVSCRARANWWTWIPARDRPSSALGQKS